MVQNNLDYGTSDVYVFNNTITNTSDAGICMNEVKNMKAMYNQVERTGVNTCIRLRNVTTAEISYNICVFASRGLRIQSSENIITLSNEIVR
jgi:hypothetical protein